MTVYAVGKSSNIRVKTVSPTSQGAVFSNSPMTGADSSRFSLFWDLMDTIKVHGYIRAAMSVIGRSTVGAWWALHQSQDSVGSERQRKRLMQFYQSPDKRWNNIKDFQGLTYKLMIGAMYLRYFGQAAYQIVRNADGVAVGIDHLPGFVVPNVDPRGYFLDPAFKQFPTRSLTSVVNFSDPRDVVYITNPDWQGYPTGGSDIEALTDYALPLDIYLQIAAREYMKNRDKPEAMYILPSDISPEAFDDFVKAINARYSGPSNIGKSPIVMSGDLKVEEFSRLSSDLPYQDARQDTRQETLAVSGVTGAKLGITDKLSSANLRESRREFYESTMLPLFRLIETAFNEQIHVREFGIPGWEFRFNSPDFLTLVERATVDMRYHEMGVLNPNEIRESLGRAKRTDEAGDKFADETPATAEPTASGEQGSPPEGRQTEPDSPSQIGEPTLDNQDPPRGDQHDDTTERAAFSEIRKWRNYSLKRVKKGKPSQGFECDVLPDYLSFEIQSRLDHLATEQEVRTLFEDIERLMLEELGMRAKQ